MTNDNAELIRRAYQAYANGQLQAMLALVDPDLEWTYLDPGLRQGAVMADAAGLTG